MQNRKNCLSGYEQFNPEPTINACFIVSHIEEPGFFIWKIGVLAAKDWANIKYNVKEFFKL